MVGGNMEGSYFLICVNVEILNLPVEYILFLMEQRVIGATLCQDGLEIGSTYTR